MEIKICGITQIEEAQFLNDAKVDYAGFVFFEKSKRNISMDMAVAIGQQLHSEIKRVAVTVSPTIELVHKIQNSGFDLLQVHKNLALDVMENCHIPIWYACNIADIKQLEEAQAFISSLPEEYQKKIEGIVVDGAEYGSGKTFDWSTGKKEMIDFLKNRKFILAGGLNAQNVREGIQIFQPDVVDVSSGVEGLNGKERELVMNFVEQVRK